MEKIEIKTEVIATAADLEGATPVYCAGDCQTVAGYLLRDGRFAYLTKHHGERKMQVVSVEWLQSALLRLPPSSVGQ